MGPVSVDIFDTLSRHFSEVMRYFSHYGHKKIFCRISILGLNVVLFTFQRVSIELRIVLGGAQFLMSEVPLEVDE